MNWKMQQGLELLQIRRMIPNLSPKKIPAEDKGSSVWIRGTEPG